MTWRNLLEELDLDSSRKLEDVLTCYEGKGYKIVIPSFQNMVTNQEIIIRKGIIIRHEFEG